MLPNLPSSNAVLVGLHSKWRDVSSFGYILDGAIRGIPLSAAVRYNPPLENLCGRASSNHFMMPFVKSRTVKQEGAAALGRLELNVMEIVWSRGESSVREVAAHLRRPLAYTTVMTTLDRLYKKNLLDRRKLERAFLYWPRFSRSDWERRRADDLLAGFLTGSPPSADLLISCLVEAVGQYDKALLDELEKKVRAKRKELLQRNGR